VRGFQLNELAHHRLAETSEVQRAHAAIGGIGPPFDQASALQLVDQRHHATRRNLQRVGECLLRLTLRRGDVQQDRRLPTWYYLFV
jgi:hypothetical protein